MVPAEWVQYARDNLPTNQIPDLLKLYPAHRDGKAALRWIFAHADTYSIDLNHITVGGGSEGAIIANAIGVAKNQDYTDEIAHTLDPTLISTNTDQVYSVHTVLDFWGSPISIELLNSIYGNQRFGDNDIPIFIAHGTNDITISFTKAEQLRDEYIKNGVAYRFVPLDGLGHSAWNAKVNGKTLGELAFEFIVEQQHLEVE